ncbi:hypothetical protein [Paraburkholderia sp. SIMBA_030]|uniref:hypothetical protein n=1 Tax=Paraburkholderia sp. SIMBA_030 TaxID=3085773 RepID=UPI00397A4E98
MFYLIQEAVLEIPGTAAYSTPIVTNRAQATDNVMVLDSGEARSPCHAQAD